MFVLSMLVMSMVLGSIGIVVGAAFYLAFGIAYYVLYAIGSYKMFVKANRPGWWAFIPFLNEYQLYKMSCGTPFFWIYMVLSLFTTPNDEGKRSFLGVICSIVTVVVELFFTNKLAKAYGKGTGFGLGLFFFQPIFVMILGLGDSEYLGPQY